MEKKTCETCFWSSREGYCTEGGRPPQKCKDVCDKHTSLNNKDAK